MEAADGEGKGAAAPQGRLGGFLCVRALKSPGCALGSGLKLQKFQKAPRRCHNSQPRRPYSFSGVVHRRSRSFCFCSATQTVSNAVGGEKFFSEFWLVAAYFGFGSGTNRTAVRTTNIAQRFVRSRDPNTDTHSQVMTGEVSRYTACAPCFQKER